MELPNQGTVSTLGDIKAVNIEVAIFRGQKKPQHFLNPEKKIIIK